MPSYFSEEEYKYILSKKPKPAPAGSASKGMDLSKMGDIVPREEYDKLVADPPYTPPVPEPPISRIAEGAKGLARGTLELATSIGGAGVEAAGQIGAGAIDAARAPQAFPGMTEEQFQQMVSTRRTQVPTQNPFEGQTQVAQQVFQPDRASLQSDPRTTPENAPYIKWGGPGGYVPIPQVGTAQQARLAGEAGSMAPAAAATIGAAAATGGIGPAGALAGGAMGGAIEGLSEYQQVLDSGGQPEDALRAASIMGTGAAALNAIPFVAYSTRFLPKGMRNSVGKAMISFIAEGFTETTEGSVSEISRMDKIPKSAAEWEEAYSKVKQGFIDESNVFLVAGLMGGGTSLLSQDDAQPTPPPATTTTTPAAPTTPPTPVDALQPGPNAPTPQDTLFEDDFTPWEAPQAAVAEPVAQEEPLTPEMEQLFADNPELQAILNSALAAQATPEQTALEQQILGVDLIDSREIAKPEPAAPQTARQKMEALKEARKQSLIDTTAVSQPTTPPIRANNITSLRNIDVQNAPIEQVRAIVEMQDRLSAINDRKTIAPYLTEEQLNKYDEMVGGNAEWFLTWIDGLPKDARDAYYNANASYSPETYDLYLEALERIAIEDGSGDMVSMKDAPKLPVEVRKPAPPLIEARPALDVGRPVEEQAPDPQTAREKLLARVSVRAQDRPRPGNRIPEQVPSPEVRATVRNRSQKGVATTSEPDVMEPASTAFDLETMPMEQIDAFMADEDAKSDAKERELLQKNLTPAQIKMYDALGGNSDAVWRRKAKFLDKIRDGLSDEIADSSVTDWETARRYRQVETLREKLSKFSGEDEVEGMKDLELFFREANFEDPVDVRVLKEMTQRLADNGLDVNEMLRKARAAYGTRIYEQTRDMNDALDMVASLDEKLGIPTEPEEPATQPAALPKPPAEFVGMQERPRGQAPIPLYNIPDGNGGKTTVSAETARAQGYDVPETVQADPATIRADIKAIASATDRTRLADIREKLPQYDRDTLDKELIAMQRDGELVLNRNDDPQDITARDEAAKLEISGERRDLVYLTPQKADKTPKEKMLEKRKAFDESVRTREIADDAAEYWVRTDKSFQSVDEDLYENNKEYRNLIKKGEKSEADEPTEIFEESPRLVIQEMERRGLPVPDYVKARYDTPQKKAQAMRNRAKEKGDEAGFANVGAMLELPGKLFGLMKNVEFIEFKQGYGTGEAKDAVMRRRGRLKSFEMRGKLIEQDFETAYMKIYRRENRFGVLTNRLQKVPDALQREINKYLIEPDPDVKADLLAALPVEMRETAVKARQLVDDMTDHLIELGVVTDEEGERFEENKGVYLRRTYDIGNDPDFRENRDPRIEKMARDWVKQNFPEYSEQEVNMVMGDLDRAMSDKDSMGRLIKRGGILGKLDRSTLGERGDIPIPIQKFWGVSERGIDNVLNSVNSQAHIIANYELLSELADKLNGTQVATAELLREIKRGTYKGENADEISSWPFLNDADANRSVKKHSRVPESVEKQKKAIEDTLKRLDAAPQSPKRDGLIKKLKEDLEIQRRGLKRDKAGVMSVDENNLDAAATYIEDLTAQVDGLSRSYKKGARGDAAYIANKQKYFRLRKELDKYTRQYNKAVSESVNQDELPSMFGSFGPLAGARIHPDLKAALKEAMEVSESSVAVDTLKRLNALAKKNVTTYDTASAARNLQSGIDFSFANGWFLYDSVNAGKRLAQAFEIASVDIMRSHSPAMRDKYLRLVELGVAGDTAVVGDITETAKNAKKAKLIRKFIKNMPQTTALAESVDALATKLYQAGDDVFKIFGWLTETQQIVDTYGMSESDAEAEAAKRIRRQFPTYSELPKWAQSLKRFPVLGPFVAYQTETYRATWNTLAQGIIEVKNGKKTGNAKERRMGYRRLSGMMWAMTNRKAYLIAAAAVFGIEPDDEDAVQLALPEFYRDHSIAITEADRATGKYAGYNISTMDAYNVLKEPAFAAMRSDDPLEAMGVAAKTIGKAYYSPELGTNLGAELITNWFGSSDSIFNESDNFFEKLGKTAAEGAKTFALPGTLRRHLKADTPEEQAAEIMASLTGMKKIEVDLPNSLMWMARDMMAVPREQSKDVYREIRAGDKAGAMQQIGSANATRKDRFEDLHKAYTAFKAAGTREDLLTSAMKEAGLSEKMINAVKYNQYENWEGSKPMREALAK